jgi:hypothetical protein
MVPGLATLKLPSAGYGNWQATIRKLHQETRRFKKCELPFHQRKTGDLTAG